MWIRSAAVVIVIKVKDFHRPCSHSTTVARCSSVLSHLDFAISCRTVLFGSPQQLVDKLQSVENAAALLIFAALVATTSAHCCRVFTGCGLLIVLHFDWRYSTVQHPSICCRKSLILTHVCDFALRLLLLWLLRGPVKLPLVVDVSLPLQPDSLEQFARSSQFFSISGAVQKDVEDGTVRAILYRLTDSITICTITWPTDCFFPLLREVFGLYVTLM